MHLESQFLLQASALAVLALLGLLTLMMLSALQLLSLRLRAESLGEDHKGLERSGLD